MRRITGSSIISVLAVCAWAWSASSADAAVLSVSPHTQDMDLDSSVVVEIRLDSEGEVVNALETVITYPTDHLELTEVSTGGSLFSLWVEGPVADTDAGTVRLVGGIPDGSFVDDGIVVRLTFTALQLGLAQIRFDGTQTSLRANDGLGTAVPIRYFPGDYTIIQPSELRRTIRSLTHPQEESWYGLRDIDIAWDMRDDAQYSFDLLSSPAALPDDLPDTTTGNERFTDVADGIHYFVLKERTTDSGWTVVGRRRFQIDGTPPELFTPILTRQEGLYDDAWYVVFSAVDLTSGIEGYAVIEDGEMSTGASSPHVLRTATGDILVQVIARDRAGNIRESEIDGSRSPLITTDREGSTDLWWWIIAILLLLLGIIVEVLVRRRHTIK